LQKVNKLLIKDRRISARGRIEPPQPDVGSPVRGRSDRPNSLRRMQGVVYNGLGSRSYSLRAGEPASGWGGPILPRALIRWSSII